jgi:hypothetical protein
MGRGRETIRVSRDAVAERWIPRDATRSAAEDLRVAANHLIRVHPFDLLIGVHP